MEQLLKVVMCFIKIILHFEIRKSLLKDMNKFKTLPWELKFQKLRVFTFSFDNATLAQKHIFTHTRNRFQYFVAKRKYSLITTITHENVTTN